ncbi:MAG TPA: hypothetical protein VER79_14525 [Candidatus Limnocylindrales bacterium]|nr:hypothetical protein [Candidatus Limnocylindrales bacterium]
MTLIPADKKSDSWKLTAYAAGVVGGALFGILAAVLYARSAEASLARGGERPEIGTMSIIGLTISLINIVRQITELGESD